MSNDIVTEECAGNREKYTRGLQAVIDNNSFDNVNGIDNTCIHVN